MSAVWGYFEVSDDGKSRAECILFSAKFQTPARRADPLKQHILPATVSYRAEVGSGNMNFPKIFNFYIIDLLSYMLVGAFISVMESTQI